MPGPLVMEVRSGVLVEEELCAVSGFAPTSGLLLRRSGTRLTLTWEPSTNPTHASYRVRAATGPMPSSAPGSFPDDPVFTDVTALDTDGSATDESFTFDLSEPFGYFLVTDINAAGEEGPSEHYE